MEITENLRKRFCRDCNIPIKIYREPYFSQRLKLYDKYFGTLEKWALFVSELEKYENEQDYNEEYNRVKDEAIESIKQSEGYLRFNSEDMNSFAVHNKNFPHVDIFKPSNDGKRFISIDMKKANFSALSHYDSSIFGNVSTWEDFIRRFTNNEHIINSKYIRQVVLGNCNPKRHITYEKYLMDKLLTEVRECKIVEDSDIVFFSNDEIVLDVTLNSNEDYIVSCLEEITNKMELPFRVEAFTLRKICKDGYMRKFIDTDKVDFKCIDSNKFPFVLRALNGERVTESDKVFICDGVLCMYLESPDGGIL